MISFMITTGSLNSQDMIRNVKQDMISQVNVYVMDTVFILCDVMCGGQYSTEGCMVL